MTKTRATKYNKNPETTQKKILSYLYCLACEAPDMKRLYNLRSCELSEKLEEKNYLKFIRVVDRLMESL